MVWSRSYSALALLAVSVCAAQCHAEDDRAYEKAIQERGARIVAPLAIDDAEKRERVTDHVVSFYRDLSQAHAGRDESLAGQAETEAAILDASHREIVALHRRFVAGLLAELTPEQVEQIKNGITYGVVPITLEAYGRLLPDLTAEQKRYIHANLLEAREYAMDAGTSDEKHAWFGKYKGRINNYLSAAGYDLKQAERDLANRTREQ